MGIRNELKPGCLDEVTNQLSERNGLVEPYEHYKGLWKVRLCVCSPSIVLTGAEVEESKYRICGRARLSCGRGPDVGIGPGDW